MRPGQVIVIRNFAENFTVSQNGKVKGPMSWVALPTKHDGKSFRRLMQHDHGAAIYGAWGLLVQVSAKCPRHGVLADEDGPLTFEDLELKTGCPSKVFREAVEVLSGKGINWIEVVDPSTAVDDGRARSLYVTGQDGTERNVTNVRTEGGPEFGNSKELDGGGVEIRCLKRVTEKHLGMTPAIVELADRIRQEVPGHIPEGDDGVSLLIAATERAKAEGRSPEKLFRWMVRHSRWDMLTGPEQKKAADRLREYRASHPARDGPGPPKSAA